ncbi:MAG: flagellar motor switch protein FliG [Planctomycetes bacterium]|nr:flagellar motor switch protein FliG [Planctomycetota bacterium]
MDDVRKAAIVVLSLDKPLASEIIAQLSRDEAEALTAALARLDDVTEEQQEAVIEEFLQAASKQVRIERGGVEYASELLEQSLGREFASEIINNVRRSLSSVPFGFLQQAGADNLLTFISEEHPQTIALIMAHLPPAMAAEVLSGLPSNKQMEVVRRIANMEQTNPEVVQDVEETLKQRMRSAIGQRSEVTGGVQLVAQILNVTDRATNKGILENLEQEDAELVEEIQRLMFVFEDLLKLDDKSIQRLLKEVDNNQWALALKGASEEIKQRILGNLSQRAAELLKEEMEYLGPVRVSDVEAAQQQIVDTVRRLEDAGEIVIAAGGEEEFIT